tara:strand:- start:99 stop:464 length:366 start_codon:yes stop_codon:yes gene_type:complete
MKTFDSGLNDITVDKNNLITKIDFRDCWSFDIELHPSIQECMGVFEDNLLNEFKISQPSNIQELEEIFVGLWNYWDMNTINQFYTWSFDESELKFGYGYRRSDNFDYNYVTEPMIIFRLKK